MYGHTNIKLTNFELDRGSSTHDPRPHCERVYSKKIALIFILSRAACQPAHNNGCGCLS